MAHYVEAQHPDDFLLDLAPRLRAAARRMMEEPKTWGDQTDLFEPADLIPPNAVGNNPTVTIAPGQQSLDFQLRKSSISTRR